MTTVKDANKIPTADESSMSFTEFSTSPKRSQSCLSPNQIIAGIHRHVSLQASRRYYDLLVMPFSLCNAPTTFQWMMNIVFKQKLRKSILVFFDNIYLSTSRIAVSLEPPPTCLSNTCGELSCSNKSQMWICPQVSVLFRSYNFLRRSSSWSSKNQIHLRLANPNERSSIVRFLRTRWILM